MRELFDAVIIADQVMRKFATITIGHRSYDRIRIAIIDQRYFCDFGKVFAKHILVFVRCITDFMIINLLKKMGSFSAFIRAGITGVPEATAIRAPRQATTASRVLNPW